MMDHKSHALISGEVRHYSINVVSLKPFFHKVSNNQCEGALSCICKLFSLKLICDLYHSKRNKKIYCPRNYNNSLHLSRNIVNFEGT